MGYTAGFKESNKIKSGLWDGGLMESCGQNPPRHNTGASRKGGVVEAFVYVCFASGHLTLMDGGCI
jgi:hypothetical protein